jgi:hypothetical protein
MKINELENQTQENRFEKSAQPKEQGTRINGMQQVVDLLRHADPVFRESLLKRLQQRDPALVQNLRKIFR